MTTRIQWTVSSESESKARATYPAPVVASVGLRAAAAADLCASLAQLLGPVLDVLIRLWLAEGFLVTDVLEHMLPGGQLSRRIISRRRWHRSAGSPRRV